MHPSFREDEGPKETPRVNKPTRALVKGRPGSPQDRSQSSFLRNSLAQWLPHLVQDSRWWWVWATRPQPFHQHLMLKISYPLPPHVLSGQGEVSQHLSWAPEVEGPHCAHEMEALWSVPAVRGPPYRGLQVPSIELGQGPYYGLREMMQALDIKTWLILPPRLLFLPLHPPGSLF